MNTVGKMYKLTAGRYLVQIGVEERLFFIFLPLFFVFFKNKGCWSSFEARRTKVKFKLSPKRRWWKGNGPLGKMSVGGRSCQTVTGSVIKTETPPAKPLYVSFPVMWTNFCLPYYWLLVVWLPLFTNCTVSIEVSITVSILFCLSSHHSFLPLGRIFSGGSSWALNDLSSSNLCVFLPWLLLPSLLCRTWCGSRFACCSACFKLWNTLQVGPRTCMLEFLLPMPFFPRLVLLQWRECGKWVHWFLSLLLCSFVEKADEDLLYYALCGVYRWKSS